VVKRRGKGLKINDSFDDEDDENESENISYDNHRSEQVSDEENRVSKSHSAVINLSDDSGEKNYIKTVHFEKKSEETGRTKKISRDTI